MIRTQTPQLAESGCFGVLRLGKYHELASQKDSWRSSSYWGVLAQLSQRREAAVPVLVDKVEVRIGVHGASALEVDEGPVPDGKVEVRIGVHEEPAFKVDECDLYLAAGAPGSAGQKTTVAILVAHASYGGRRRPRGGRKLPKTKRPRSKSTSALGPSKK